MIQTWTSKIKRFGIGGKMFWYHTDDGGFSWRRISAAKAMEMIDNQQGVIIK